MSDIKIEVYPALEGDCFLIRMNDQKKTNILIDGGFSETYHDYLKPRLLQMAKNGEELSLVIVTHVDQDHIEGIIELFNENGTADDPKVIPIKEVWHNSYRHLNFLNQKKEEELDKNEISILNGITSQSSIIKSERNNEPNKDISAKDGSTLAGLLYGGKYNWNRLFDGSAINCDEKAYISLTSEINIYLLSPNSEKLKKLEKTWIKELRKSKYDFKLNESKIFDDAYEYYLLSLHDENEANESKDISGRQEKISLDNLLKKKLSSDNSVVNGSSISFILEYKQYKLLFLADAHPNIIRENIQKLVSNQECNPFFDMIKVSHHGSYRNTSVELLSLIDSPIYLFSTNGRQNEHPNMETLARIISRKSIKRRLVFNYPISNEILLDEALKRNYCFTTDFSNGQQIKVIEIQKG
ncbi:hypothetical protein BK126_04600 [Paenibacillus sp. FSL H7-0326]|uniref:AVAST type 1 anti-phage system MBL fold metallo-hydrolase Avs1a n=1 Tax=Paenibacillus sp. FSL H7-0326 TaxID=1921144 RepID=UPI00096CD622|nr:AVAST type 1 anti-phage system MBL fold metallo-hydrolase Avs1a [Paenibacillus sp. FSL H7-0326]OMC71380.1 hypothetical protein BK126_04600 [Paenibacillus sp. FSL H7-0326]